MPEAKHITSPTPYASSGDFRRIFHEERDGLYRLSFLLAADREKAEQCFVSGMFTSVLISAVSFAQVVSARAGGERHRR